MYKGKDNKIRIVVVTTKMTLSLDIPRQIEPLPIEYFNLKVHSINLEFIFKKILRIYFIIFYSINNINRYTAKLYQIRLKYEYFAIFLFF